MISLRVRLPFVFTLVFATVATCLVADEQRDAADLPAPLTSKSSKKDSLDELDVGPVKPLPYEALADDPLTPISQSTVAQFVTSVNDVDPNDILERPGIPVGWFTDLELTAANARMSNRMNSEGLLTGTFPSPVSVPSASLDWTAMPKITLGYRMAEGWGELSASYRILSTQGSGSASPGSESSRLLQQVLDLDYSLTDLFPNDLWLVPRQIRLSGGVRVAGIDYKTSANGGTIVGQSVQNTFYGAGPRFALESNYPLACSGWTLFGKVDAAGVIGTDRQTFSQTTSGGGGASASASTSPSTIASPVVGLRTGVNWYPDWGSGNLKLSAGYQWERWYYLGTDTSSFNELTIQGPFVRGELAF